MLTQKRNKIRKQLRSEELSRKFAIKRKALLEGRVAIFRELQQQIRACEHEATLQFGLNVRLLNCAQLYEHEENTYILIGNYLIDHPDACVYFQEFVLASPRYLQSYLWCLQMLLGAYSERVRVEGGVCDLQGKLASVMHIMEELRVDMEGRAKQKEQQKRVKQMQVEYLSVIYRLTLIGLVSTESLEPIKYSFSIINAIDLSCYETQELQHFYNFFQALKRQWQFIEQHRLCANYTIAFSRIVVVCLKSMPQIRLQCVKLLHFLLSYENETFFMAHIYSREMLTELIYLFEEIPSLRTEILSLLKSILHEVSINDLSSVLSLGIHVILTKGIEQSMSTKDNEQLQICLAGIVNLLARLKHLDEEKLLRTVLRDIENVDFHLMIEGLVNNEQNEIIGNLVNIVIDDYYSEEVV